MIQQSKKNGIIMMSSSKRYQERLQRDEMRKMIWKLNRPSLEEAKKALAATTTVPDEDIVDVILWDYYNSNSNYSSNTNLWRMRKLIHVLRSCYGATPHSVKQHVLLLQHNKPPGDDDDDYTEERATFQRLTKEEQDTILLELTRSQDCMLRVWILLPNV
eukprot:PhF_6_TR29126/c0_g1_i1/m.42516